ncbi:MAG: hypothetical protein ACJAZS_000437 [Alteromonas naphthalenivorans]|jgi:hypothetical protein
MKKLLLLGLLLIPITDTQTGKKKKQNNSQILTLQQAQGLHIKIFDQDTEFTDIQESLDAFRKQDKQVETLEALLHDARMIRTGILKNNKLSPNIPNPSFPLQMNILHNTLYGASGRGDLDQETVVRYSNHIQTQIDDLRILKQQQEAKTQRTLFLKEVVTTAKTHQLKRRKTQRENEIIRQKEKLNKRKERERRKSQLAKEMALTSLDTVIDAQEPFKIPEETSLTISNYISHEALILSKIGTLVRTYNTSSYGDTNHKLTSTIRLPPNNIIDVNVILQGYQSENTQKEFLTAKILIHSALSKLTPGCNIETVKKTIADVQAQIRPSSCNCKCHSFHSLLTLMLGTLEEAFSLDTSCTIVDNSTLKTIRLLEETYSLTLNHDFDYHLLEETYEKKDSRPDTKVVITPCNSPQQDSGLKKEKEETQESMQQLINAAMSALRAASPISSMRLLTKEDLKKLSPIPPKEQPLSIAQEFKEMQRSQSPLVEEFTQRSHEIGTSNTLQHMQSSFANLLASTTSEKPTCTEVVFCPYHAFNKTGTCYLYCAPPLPDYQIEQIQKFLTRFIDWIETLNIETDSFFDENLPNPQIAPFLKSIQKAVQFSIFESQVKKEPVDTKILIDILKTYRDSILPHGWECRPKPI